MNLESFCSRIRLVGTEPQIKWATTIRKKRVEDMKKMSLRHMALLVKPMLTEEQCNAMGIKTKHHAHQFLSAVAKYTLSCPSAVWWISNRDIKLIELVPTSVRVCVDHFSKTKPFK